MYIYFYIYLRKKQFFLHFQQKQRTCFFFSFHREISAIHKMIVKLKIIHDRFATNEFAR